jgi:hypothetical protein
MRRRAYAVAAGVIVLAVAATVGLIARGGEREPTPSTAGRPSTAQHKSHAQLVAANYKVLTPARTAQLLRFADAAYTSMSKQLHLGPPKTERTRIVMAIPPGTSPATVARVGLACAASVGDPPPDASFQVRGHAVIVYLPKYCILDRKTVKRAA